MFAEWAIILQYFSPRLTRDCFWALNNFSFQEAKGPCNQTKKDKETGRKITFPKSWLWRQKKPLHPLLEPGEETPRDPSGKLHTLCVVLYNRNQIFLTIVSLYSTDESTAWLSSQLGMNSGANRALDSRNYKFSVSHTCKVIGQQTSLFLAIIKIKPLFSPSIKSAQGQTWSSIQEQMGAIQHHWFGNIWVRSAGEGPGTPCCWGEEHPQIRAYFSPGQQILGILSPI